ncbi:MAG: DUF5123 domain-containing protein, partial [Stigonema ocellatum SAG 48.90 = DSM 106950]|nr:DUF5123 domain-containing protein [Stigonema ocellatum SAG 48.90 = DSM 106950]
QGVNGGKGIAVGSNVNHVEIVNNTVVKNVQAISIDGADYNGGYTPYDILVRNNIFANSSYVNGFIESVDQLTLDHNLFTDQFANLYESGSGITNLNAYDNTQVPSVRFVNLDGNDFHLTSTSPAIGLGSQNIGQYAQFDKDGLQRQASTGINVGAY